MSLHKWVCTCINIVITYKWSIMGYRDPPQRLDKVLTGDTRWPASHYVILYHFSCYVCIMLVINISSPQPFCLQGRLCSTQHPMWYHCKDVNSYWVYMALCYCVVCVSVVCKSFNYIRSVEMSRGCGFLVMSETVLL